MGFTASRGAGAGEYGRAALPATDAPGTATGRPGYDALPMTRSVQQQLPNAITLLRLVLAAAFFALLNLFRFPGTGVLWANLAIAVFVLAAISDWLDGWLARRWNAVSPFGRIMDPFCDKVLILGAFIYLAGPRFVVPQWVTDDNFFTMATGVYPWMVVLVLARELLVTSIRGVVESSGSGFGAQQLGKIKMIVQSIAVPVILFLTVNFRPDRHELVMWINHGLVYIAVFVTMASMLPYFRGIGRFMATREEEAR